MSEFDSPARSDKRARRGKHRGEPMSLLQELRGGRRRARITVPPTSVPGVRRSRRHAGA